MLEGFKVCLLYDFTRSYNVASADEKYGKSTHLLDKLFINGM